MRFRSNALRGLTALTLASLLVFTSQPASAADPTTADCLGANEHAITLRAQNKLREARSQLLVCAAETCPTDIRNECARRVGEVNASMPTLVFEAKDAAGNDLSAVRVTMDGHPLVERLEGTALSIDPGEHKFSFETSGQPTVAKQFVIRAGEKDRRERITFGASAPFEPTSSATTTFNPASQPVDRSEAEAAPRSTQRILGWSGVGLGAVGVALGVVFTAQKSSKDSDADAICPTGKGCSAGDNARIRSLTDEANTKGTLAAVSFVAGGLLVAGGLVAVFTAPDKSRAVSIAPAIGPNFRGFLVAGNIW